MDNEEASGDKRPKTIKQELEQCKDGVGDISFPHANVSTGRRLMHTPFSLHYDTVTLISSGLPAAAALLFDAGGEVGW